ncbi:MBL fold metallo-hydrolase [Bacillus timonensis]|nr:MBL fold metallo-hydrolase [Bacillus timonensis]
MNALGTKDIFKISLPTPFPVGDVNVYLIKGDRLTLIDIGAKTEEAWLELKNQLHVIGYDVTDIEQVILTHHHPDHVGLLDFMAEDIPIIGHPLNQPWISRDEVFSLHSHQFFKELFVQLGIHPAFQSALSGLNKTLRFSCQRSLTSEIVEGATLPGLPEWSIYETPGHAQSHLIFYRETDGVVIGGDHLLAKISSNPLLEPPIVGHSERPKPQVQYNASLKKLLQLDISKVFSGHGDDVLNAHNLIQKRLIRQDERAYSVRDMLLAKPMTAFEVCIQLFPSVYKKELMLTMSETVGQLDYLEDLGEIKKEQLNQQFIYTAL